MQSKNILRFFYKTTLENQQKDQKYNQQKDNCKKYYKKIKNIAKTPSQNLNSMIL